MAAWQDLMRWNNKSIFIGVLLAAMLLLSIAIKTYVYPPDVPPTSEKLAPSQWQKIPGENAIIRTPTTFQPVNKTFVTIPIKYSGEPIETWLSFESSNSAVLSNFLVHSPQLAALKWPIQEDKALRIFQKKHQYPTVATLLAQAPLDRVFITEELKQLPLLAKVSNQVLQPTTDLNQVDYIISTYQPLEKKDDGYLFTRLIDATTARLDSNRSIGWVLSAAGTTKDTPFYIGPVHVDYRY